MIELEYIAFILACFLGVHFLFLNTREQKSNIYLGLILIVMAMSFISDHLFPTLKDSILISIFDILNSGFTLPILLIFYFHSVSRFSRQSLSRYRYLLFFIVADTCVSIILHANSFSSTTNEIVLQSSHFLGLLFNLVIYGHLLVELKKHRTQLLDEFSDVENKRLNWLRVFIIFNLFFSVIWLIDDGLAVLIGDNFISEVIAFISIYATFINVIWIGFSALRQKPIFTEQPPTVSPSLNTIAEHEVEIIEKTSTEDETERAYFKELEQVILDNHYFSDSELSLSRLAGLLSIKPKELSRLINQYSQTNFYGYINTMRVHHFIHLYQSGQNEHLSILGLAQSAGFKSKSTFYKSFKAVMGTSPTEYFK